MSAAAELIHEERAAARTYEHVPLAELERARLDLAISPLPTVFLHARLALTEGRIRTISSRGHAAVAPNEWAARARSHLRARDRETLAPLLDPRALGWPTGLTSVVPGRSTMAESLEQVRSLGGDALAADLGSGPASGPPAAWEGVLSDPDRWVGDFVDAMQRAWLGLESVWERSSALLDRETERVASAHVRGANGQLADTLHPYSSIADGAWNLHELAESMPLRIERRRLKLTPILVDGLCFIDSDGSTLREVGYPLPAVWRAFEGRVPPPASLEALIGDTRAALLRQLDAPVTTRRLAEALDVVPSAITYHVGTLETAGLVTRERRGRQVDVTRTERGTQLLALYERS